MRQYIVKIEPEAISDIQNITNWYNEAQEGLGKRFQDTVINQINSLKKNPHIYAVRYKEIRCMIVKKFPYMVHFYINEANNTSEVIAVISTFQNPTIWDKKTTR